MKAVRRRIPLCSGPRAPKRGSTYPENVLNADAFGPALRIRRIEVPICEYAMEGGPLPIPARLRYLSTKYILLSTVSVTKQGITDSAARKSPIRELIFANAQCKAPYRRIRRYSCSQASSRHIRPRWTKLPRLYLRARRRTRRFEGPIFANTQYEALHRRIPLGARLQAPSRGQNARC